MKAEPLVAAIEHVVGGGAAAPHPAGRRAARASTSARAAALARGAEPAARLRALRGRRRARAALGRRGAVDRRLRALAAASWPPLVVIDAVARLLPGVLGNAASAPDESFATGLLEYPQYTRPWSFRGARRARRARLRAITPRSRAGGASSRCARRSRGVPTCCARRRSTTPTVRFLRALGWPRRGARTMADLYLALLHHPVYDKNGAVVTTAVTNLDVHDIARLARTFGVRGFYVCTPVATLRRLVARIIRHWDVGPGRDLQRHPQGGARARRAWRRSSTRPSPTIERETGQLPRLVATSARGGADASDATPRCASGSTAAGPPDAAGLRDRLGAHRGGPRARRRRPRAHPGHRATTTTCRSAPPPPSSLTGSATDDKTCAFP